MKPLSHTVIHAHAHTRGDNYRHIICQAGEWSKVSNLKRGIWPFQLLYQIMYYNHWIISLPSSTLHDKCLNTANSMFAYEGSGHFQIQWKKILDF